MIWSDRTIDPSITTDEDTRRSLLVRRLLRSPALSPPSARS
jgi:hypothetical protein